MRTEPSFSPAATARFSAIDFDQCDAADETALMVWVGAAVALNIAHPTR